MSQRAVVLVVDDEPRNLRLLQATLGFENYDVVSAVDGRSCLDVVARQGVDIILLDVMMPGIDGFEVLRTLRADARYRLIPVVLLTALDATEDRVRGIEAGCDDFISKPFEKSELLARIRTLLTISYYRRQLDEKEKLEAAISAAHDGMIVCSPDWIVQRFNPAARRYFDLGDESTVSFLDAVRRRYSCAVPFPILADIERAPREFELIREETPHFRGLHLRIATTVIRDPSGAVTSLVVCAYDVTDLVREQRLKADFVSLISHKLRTPMTPIMLSLSILKEDLAGREDVEPFLDQIATQIGRMHDLVERLIEFVSATADSQELTRTAVAVRDRLQALVNDHVTAGARGGLVWLQDGSANPTLDIYPRLFDLVIANLIDNGLKFNDCLVPQVRLSVSESGPWTIVGVTDNGRGIPPEDQERVFDEFTQTEKDFTGSVPGIGLGLAIVRRIVSAYGGRVEVASEVGKGSTLTAVFPTARRQTPAETVQSVPVPGVPDHFASIREPDLA